MRTASDAARDEYGIRLSPIAAMADMDGVILAVPHRQYREASPAPWQDGLTPGGILMDVKAVLEPAQVPEGATYWSL